MLASTWVVNAAPAGATGIRFEVSRVAAVARSEVAAACTSRIQGFERLRSGSLHQSRWARPTDRKAVRLLAR